MANLEPIHFVKQVWCDCGGGKIVAFSSSTFRVIGSPGTKGHEFVFYFVCLFVVFCLVNLTCATEFP